MPFNFDRMVDEIADLIAESVCATSTYSSSSINDAAGIAISCRGLEPFASGIR